MNANYFRTLGSVESSFKLLRIVMLSIIVAVLLFAAVIAYWAFNSVEASRQRVYVMDNGKSIMLALAQDHNINRPAEAKDHVRSFLKLLFELEPDEKQIDASIEQATYLGNKASVVRLYTDLKEKGYYNQLIQGDVHQKVEIELSGIQVQMDQSPYYFRAKGRQVLIRSTNVTVRNLDVEGYLIDVARTDNNPHGFMVERFKVLDNRDIETIDRAPDSDKLNL
ncbi:conjugative transposon TraK protein [Spirosoma oryzae]|uniref:Conjugative transposon TraK protein n=1 Tax=Spirosoma oryzae TaxID=1469603 RepID=A0A2T0S335_9BACT|nr:conjugative transposon protein TraK [Spirosoma oryzae]PRY27820.1 conjugative transposon TraK protein [Spirosoma oryzae]